MLKLEEDVPDPPPELKLFVEHTLLELTRYGRWLELSIDNEAPAATVLTILDEVSACLKMVVERAEGTAFRTETLAKEIERFSELRSQGAHRASFGADLAISLSRVQRAVMQLLHPPPLLNSPLLPPRPLAPCTFMHQAEPDPAQELQCEAHSSSDEEVMRMNGGQQNWGQGYGAPKELQDGRHVDLSSHVSWNHAQDPPQGGVQGWRALSPAKSPKGQKVATRALSQLSIKKMLRVPALALNWLSNDSSSSTPRSAPSAPNSARLMISPRSAFEFTSMSSLSYRSSNTEPESDC